MPFPKKDQVPNSVTIISEGDSNERLAAQLRLFGNNVRAERQKRKLSLSFVTRCLNLSPSYLGLLERGDRSPSIRTLLQLCALFSCSADSLLFTDRSNADESVTHSFAEPLDRAHTKKMEAAVALTRMLTAAELDFMYDSLHGVIALRSENAWSARPTN